MLGAFSGGVGRGLASELSGPLKAISITIKYLCVDLGSGTALLIEIGLCCSKYRVRCHHKAGGNSQELRSISGIVISFQYHFNSYGSQVQADVAHWKRFSAAFQLITFQIALKYSALRF